MMLLNKKRLFAEFLMKNKQNLVARLWQQKSYATEATFQTQEYKTHKLDKTPSTEVTLSKEDGLYMLRKMHAIRKMEHNAAQMYREKLIRGFLHLYSGQEAVCVGMVNALRPHDTVITAYRCHGWTYMMGSSAAGVLAELTGKASGCAKGKGGSMHMYTPTFYGGNGIVGAQIPLGVGLAFAAKYNNTDGVAVALYGDGAANQGQLAEVFNIAKLLSLPCIFVCENNGYGMGTSSSRASANTIFYTRGHPMAGLWVDGMDILATREATKFAINLCKEGNGPILIEMATYRYFGHSVSDPGTSYRTRDEIQEVRKTRDPILLLKGKLVSSNLATEDELKQVETEAAKEIDEAIAKSKSDPEPPESELAADIYAKWDVGVRGTLPITEHQHTNLNKPKNL